MRSALRGEGLSYVLLGVLSCKWHARMSQATKRVLYDAIVSRGKQGNRTSSTFAIHKHPSIALSQISLIAQQEKLSTYRSTHKQVTRENSCDL